MIGTIVVRGAHAEAYRAYRDVRADIGELVGEYRRTLLQAPKQADAQTLAIVLSKQVRFAPAAHDLFARALADDGGALVPFAELRPHLQVKDAARELIVACEQAQNVEPLAAALVLLFIEAHPRTVKIEEPDELPPEDEGDEEDVRSLPDEPPEGYGG